MRGMSAQLAEPGSGGAPSHLPAIHPLPALGVPGSPELLLGPHHPLRSAEPPGTPAENNVGRSLQVGVHPSKHLVDPGLPSGLSTNPPRLTEAGILGHRERRGLPGAGVGSTIFQRPWDMRTGFLPQDDISISQAHVASKLHTCACATHSTGPAWALQLCKHSHTHTHTHTQSKQKILPGRVDPLIFVLKPKGFDPPPHHSIQISPGFPLTTEKVPGNFSVFAHRTKKSTEMCP